MSRREIKQKFNISWRFSVSADIFPKYNFFVKFPDYRVVKLYILQFKFFELWKVGTRLGIFVLKFFTKSSLNLSGDNKCSIFAVLPWGTKVAV